MAKNNNQLKNKKQNKSPTNNKGNSQGMDTLQTTASQENPDHKVR